MSIRDKLGRPCSEIDDDCSRCMSINGRLAVIYRRSNSYSLEPWYSCYDVPQLVNELQLEGLFRFIMDWADEDANDLIDLVTQLEEPDLLDLLQKLISDRCPIYCLARVNWSIDSLLTACQILYEAPYDMLSYEQLISYINDQLGAR